MTETLFHPYEALARKLLPATEAGSDGAHDLSHLARVWRNAVAIQSTEGGDLEILAGAVLLHDCVYVPKNSPDRPLASKLAAVKADALLRQLGWGIERVAQVAHAIETHSFSAGVTPLTLEARILQDADRLDAIGAIGIARCFYTAGRMGSELYHAIDPQGRARSLDDAKYALDHFPNKLFRLAEDFRTATGQHLARERHTRLEQFAKDFLAEVTGSADPAST